MPYDATLVGQSTEPILHEVDARWIMSYAAGLNDFNPAYLGTDRAKVVAHPLFPVCLEWPTILRSRHIPGYDTLTPAEAARSVHAAHDLHILRPIAEGETLTTQATVTGMEAIKPGAALTTRLDTRAADGELVARTWQLGIARGVAVNGAGRASEPPPSRPSLSSPWRQPQCFPIPVAANAAHVYTECARIWNPIHTDRRVALEAGLPDIILHGTATLALAVSKLVDEFLDGEPRRVRRIGGHFRAMVLMPSTVVLEVLGQSANTLFFQVLTANAEPAVSQGFLSYGGA